MSYETLKVLPGDVLTAHEYLARCKEIPAQPASTLDTSPPSRTSNAASADGAASFLLDIVASNIEDLIHRVNKGREADLTKGDLGWLVAARQAIGRMKRIEVSGVGANTQPGQNSSMHGDCLRRTLAAKEPETRSAGVAPGLTSSLDTAKARSVEPSCNTCNDTGFVTLRCPCSLPKEPLSEPAIRAAVYDCTDAQCVCGRCGPVRMAIDPWQGLGKTWGDK